MSIPTQHKHLGFTIHFDEIELEGVIAMRSSTYAALKKIQDGVDWTIKDLRQVLAATKEKLAQAEIKIAGLTKEKPAK